jgi:RimJ/RimL family protein N-acetyltransferase
MRDRRKRQLTPEAASEMGPEALSSVATAWQDAMDDIKGLTPHASRVNGTVPVATIPWRFTYLCWNIPKVYGANEAEVAIVISDDWQGKGLGAKLLGELVAIGRVEGLERIVGYILPENYVMQRICRKLGFTLRYDRFEDAMEARCLDSIHRNFVPTSYGEARR